MPLSSQIPVGTSPAHIILVEEYKALAIAFGSALKKFAPAFETRTVSSLEELEQVLDDLKPVLLVIDCDPPPLHSVNFFDRLRSIAPNTRVLIVASENAGEFAERETIRPTLEFIKKPFELQKFGAIVQRLLAHEAPESGAVRHLKVLDLVLFYAITAAPVVLRVEAAGGRSGEIHFAEGRIIHAAVMGKSGVDALEVMLGWHALRFREGERGATATRTVQGAWAPVLRAAMEGVVPEESPVREEPLVRPAKSTSAPTLPATKMVVVDDTDLLLLFVEDALSSAHPELEIITARSGFDGLKCAAAEKPDLFLLDYDLPDITGADVCEKLLESEATARIPIIMMSGHVSEMMMAAERFENVVATIAKPFLSTALIDLVERTLRDLPKLRGPFVKKEIVKIAPVEKHALPAEHLVPSRNGHSRAPKKTSPPLRAVHLPSRSLAGLAEEHIPVSILDPSPAEEQQIDEAAELSKSLGKITEKLEEEESLSTEPPLDKTPQIAAHLPAGISNLRSNAVVIGLPLEVLMLKLSPRLRVIEIHARQLSSDVSLHVLAKSLPRLPRRDTPFRLARVELDHHGQLDLVRIAPAVKQKQSRPARYEATVEGAEYLPAEDSTAIRFRPAAVAPMRLELLGLFELCGVEMSAEFEVEHMLLKIRDKRMRATLSPEVIHVGATFTIAQLSLTSSGTIAEIRLVAV